MKKLLSILLVLCMVLAAVPMLLVPAVAAEEATADQGDKLTSLVTGGENWAKWELAEGKKYGEAGAYVLNPDFGGGWHFITKSAANSITKEDGKVTQWNQYGRGWATGFITNCTTGSIVITMPTNYDNAVNGLGFAYDVTTDAVLSADVAFTVLGKAAAYDVEELYFSVFLQRGTVHTQVYPADGTRKTYSSSETGTAAGENMTFSVKSGDVLYFLFSAKTPRSDANGGTWIQGFSADIYAKPITVLSTMNSASENWPTQANKGAIGGGWGFYNYFGTTLTPITHFQDATSWWVSGNVATAGGTGGLYSSSVFEWYPNATQVASCGENQTGGFGFGYGVASAKELIIDLSFTKSASLTEGITGWFTIVKYSPNGTATLVQQKTLTGNATAETITLKDVKVSAAAGDKLLFLFAHNNTAKRTAVATEFDATIYTTTEEKQPEGTLISSLENGNENWPKWTRDNDISNGQAGAWTLSQGFGGGWNFVKKGNATGALTKNTALNNWGMIGAGWGYGLFNLANADGQIALCDANYNSTVQGIGFSYEVGADAVYSLDTAFEVFGHNKANDLKTIYFSVFRIRNGVHTQVYPATGADGTGSIATDAQGGGVKYVSSTAAYAVNELVTDIPVQTGDTIYFLFRAEAPSTANDFNPVWIQNFSADIYAQSSSVESTLAEENENWPTVKNNPDDEYPDAQRGNYLEDSYFKGGWSFINYKGDSYSKVTAFHGYNSGAYGYWTSGFISTVAGSGFPNSNLGSMAYAHSNADAVKNGIGFSYEVSKTGTVTLDTAFTAYGATSDANASQLKSIRFTIFRVRDNVTEKVYPASSDYVSYAAKPAGTKAYEIATNVAVEQGDVLLYVFRAEGQTSSATWSAPWADDFNASVIYTEMDTAVYGRSVDVNTDLSLNMLWYAMPGKTTGMEYSEDKDFATGVTDVQGVLDQNTNLYSYTYAGLAAKELNKVIYGRPYTTDGVTKEYGETVEFSLAGYFADVAAGSFTAEEKELVASVETYCKAADNYFNGAANVLGDLADFTTDKNAAAHASAALSTTLENVQFTNVSLKLEEQVQFTLYFAGKVGVTNGYKLQVATDVAFANVVGNFDFVTMSDGINSLVVADVLGGPLDYNTAYFFRVVNADGTAVVSHILEYSVAAYCDRMNNTSNDAHNALCNAIMAVYAKATNE